jgi:rhodanese-related sulfurtransferase
MAGPAKRVTPQELDEMMKFGSVQVLDMRRDWDKADTKIPGAIHVHPDAYKDFAPRLVREKPVVTYCT